MQTSLWEVCSRTSVIYLFLFSGLRLLGKREISQFSPFDLVLLLTLANAVQNAMVGDNTSLPAGLAAAGTLMVANFFFNQLLARRPRLRHLLEGAPSVLVEKGKVRWKALVRERLDYETLKEAVRQHGLERLSEVELAVMELDGSISIIGSHESTPSSLKEKKKRRSNVRIRQ